MAAQVANLPSLIIGRVLTKSNTTTAIIRVLQMQLDDKFDMFFNKRIDYKAFDKQEKTKVGDIVLLKKRPTLDCRYPLERYEISEIVYELGRIKDPLTGRPCNGLRYLDESFVAKEREDQLKRSAPTTLNALPNE
ncbi:unnamed protein product [Rotaria magnacalcarata]|uniref:Mitochondrial ribosomal protein S17 n=1 Tax=Rotaria magnacalcarata TaxID=392030 RepID=A0A815JC26_9BILA|nr:unnamed protein product [Rotaria magnacalcarata]CAF1375947.1 unnamed protein product [Rotaria magnacalcarata]CAF2105979.1 unnamed protein product [Rotaria magnacalcarata]CAF2129322.1 unnamed protein product [Rotaria magnacalcarata]CAF2172093.1 unnamed protein product [Rotaria magnacalcarata]